MIAPFTGRGKKEGIESEGSSLAVCAPRVQTRFVEIG